MASLVLSIRQANPPDGWEASWSMGGRAVGSVIEVRDAAARAVGDVGERFHGLFAQPGRPLANPATLHAFGRTLFDTFFAPAWAVVAPHVAGSGNQLLIHTVDPRVLNLPWELVELKAGLPLGCDAAWSLRRAPLETLPSSDGPLEPGHLRILFLAAAPTDQASLDYEREEDAILRATSKLRNVALRVAESGTPEELADLIAEFRPHVVHLSGHGTIDERGRGSFAFENERGHTEARDAERIVAEVFRGSPVRCVFWNGCDTSQAPVAGLCQALVQAGLPLALGWAAPVADDLATEFTEEFYRRLTSGEPLAAAAAHARQLIRESGRRRDASGEVQDATFALPQLYCAVPGDAVWDRTAAPQRYEGPRTEYALLGDGVKGLREGFVGRRRERQQLIPALHDGDVTFAVITGIGGAGKSTLATRAANRLAEAGFRIYPVRAAEGRSPEERARGTVVKLRKAFEDAFVAAGRSDLHDILTNGQLPMETRLRLAVEGLSEIQAVAVLDNFEDAMVLETRQIADPELAEFYAYLATHVTRGSRVIVTCRYLPAETPQDQANLLHLPLPDFQEADFLKFLRRDPKVEERIRQQALSADLLTMIFRTLGGTPGFLGIVRDVLRTVDPDDLLAELRGEESGTVGEQREAYYGRIFINRLYEALPLEARGVVSRVALSELPLPADAVAAVADTNDSQAIDHLDAAVSFGLVEPFAAQDLPTLYHSPGLLRPWLTASERIAEDNSREAHRRLAAFWRASYEADREQELRVPIDVELAVCRAHAASANDAVTFRWATVILARRLQHRAEWRTARTLLEDIPESTRDAECLLALADLEELLGDWQRARGLYERALELFPDDSKEKATTWHNLATIDLNEGSYGPAREKFQRALEMRQAIGDRAGEAATWHNLASIDLNEGSYGPAREKFQRALEMLRALGDRAGEAATWHQLASIDLREGSYGPAREKFQRALEMRQAIRDRAGEAATFFQLGVLAHRLGRGPDAVRLQAVCWLIDAAIGHGDADGDLKNLLALAADIGLGADDVKALIEEAGAAYQRDRGCGIIRKASE